MKTSLRVLFLLIVAPLLWAQNSSIQPVAPDEVSGTRLIPRNGAFTIDAPTGWTWHQSVRTGQPNAESRTFVAMDPQTRENFMFTVLHESSAEPVTAAYMGALGQNLEESSEQSTWRMTGFRYAETTLPIKGAFQYSCRAVSRQTGETRYRFGYIAGAETKYHFTCMTTSEKEPELFRNFVASFRQTKPAAAN